MNTKGKFYNYLKSQSISEDDDTYLGGGYAPAHITTIFQIYNSDRNVLKCGSRGIGFCIDKGVSTYVIARPNQKDMFKIFLNGESITGNTSISAIKNLIGSEKWSIEVHHYTELPLSQGFGISGAGALGAAIAINSALNLNREYSELVNAAHKAEVQNSTGLGDVVAQATGGIVLRLHEGGFNHGQIERFKTDKKTRLTICIVGNELNTSKIISNSTQIKRINSLASKYLPKIEDISKVDRISIPELTKISFNFASKTGLMARAVQQAIQHIEDNSVGFGSMIMLGNSLFAVGNEARIKQICQNYGKVMTCKIEYAPATVLTIDHREI
jgi:pantoate kinase